MTDNVFVLVNYNHEGSNFIGVFNDKALADAKAVEYNAKVEQLARKWYEEEGEECGLHLFEDVEDRVRFELDWRSVRVVPFALNTLDERYLF